MPLQPSYTGSAAMLLKFFPIACLDGDCEEMASALRWRGGWEMVCRAHGELGFAA
jgi:hypothetical protein